MPTMRLPGRRATANESDSTLDETTPNSAVDNAEKGQMSSSAREERDYPLVTLRSFNMAGLVSMGGQRSQYQHFASHAFN
jgi:hypothetical protein